MKDDYIPQLMPLMWINSVVVSLLIVMMLINLYNLKEEYVLEVIDESEKEILAKLEW